MGEHAVSVVAMLYVLMKCLLEDIFLGASALLSLIEAKDRLSSHHKTRVLIWYTEDW